MIYLAHLIWLLSEILIVFGGIPEIKMKAKIMI